MELGIYYEKICIQAVSQLVERWKMFGTSQELHKNRYQSFVVLSKLVEDLLGKYCS